MCYRDVHVRGIVGTNRIVSWTYLVSRYPKLVKTCDLICFLPDTDNISPNLGRNITTETVKTVENFKIQKIMFTPSSCVGVNMIFWVYYDLDIIFWGVFSFSRSIWQFCGWLLVKSLDSSSINMISQYFMWYRNEFLLNTDDGQSGTKNNNIFVMILYKSPLRFRFIQITPG